MDLTMAHEINSRKIEVSSFNTSSVNRSFLLLLDPLLRLGVEIATEELNSLREFVTAHTLSSSSSRHRGAVIICECVYHPFHPDSLAPTPWLAPDLVRGGSVATHIEVLR